MTSTCSLSFTKEHTIAHINLSEPGTYFKASLNYKLTQRLTTVYLNPFYCSNIIKLSCPIRTRTTTHHHQGCKIIIKSLEHTHTHTHTSAVRRGCRKMRRVVVVGGNRRTKFAFPTTSHFHCCETCVAADFRIVAGERRSRGSALDLWQDTRVLCTLGKKSRSWSH